MGRILVFIVSYNAERHICSVLERIPSELYAREGVDFLCIDDASRDDGAACAAEWAAERGFQNVLVWRNPENQGYGGNQKLGYRYALDRGYDFVILLHGDGQYAPELLPQFINVFSAEHNVRLLGTRMHSVKSALRGGMPLYKAAANRFLTWLQNTLTGQNLSEYHTGYRAYSTHFLRSVPFEINTNDFHFDTEILLQAFHIKAKIREIPIPTRYGDEICHVDGVRYARQVVRATLKFRCHQLGFLLSLRYRQRQDYRPDPITELQYASRRLAIQRIKSLHAKKVLELGESEAAVAERCAALNSSPAGADQIQFSPGIIDSVERKQLDPFAYDAVLLLDMIERLSEPERLLLLLRHSTNVSAEALSTTRLILSTPNVAFVVMRLNLLRGSFNYSERGILNISNKRLFTARSLKRMIAECGYEIREWLPIGVPFRAIMPGWFGTLLESVAQFLAKLWPTMFAFQFMVVCRPKPAVRQLLDACERQPVAKLERARVA